VVIRDCTGWPIARKGKREQYELAGETMQINAAVIQKRSGPFVIETLELTDPRPDELLVQVVASGMCQTDLHARDGYYPTRYPAVYGHEGAGIVRAVGGAVRRFVPGDHVVMSYPWCGRCPNCERQLLSYCLNARELKMRGTRADGSTLLAKGGAPVYSAFFQQSSFGSFAIANERFAVKVRTDAPLELLGPLACSGQTGAGAVLNVMRPKPGDSFAVFGVGAVGLSALMAAKITACDPIIAIDVHGRRLDLARELGATHTINHTGRSDVVDEIRRLTGSGVRFSLETSALPSVFREAIEALMPAGMCVLLGSARRGNEVSFEMPFLQDGRVVRGVVQGDSVPQVLIPDLVDFIMQGQFPIERMITFYDLADINQAARDSAEGRTIKPVLRMPNQVG
jgi:aryl-alcohol dehydrogenase